MPRMKITPWQLCCIHVPPKSKNQNLLWLLQSQCMLLLDRLDWGRRRRGIMTIQNKVVTTNGAP
jgi:hypothetical protein